MIGLSHYPTEDQSNSSDLAATHSNVNAEKYVKEAIERFNMPVMICETGFDVTKPQLAHEVMIDLFNRLTPIAQCSGIFYWEPEVDGQWKPASYDSLGWGAYGMGAFTINGMPTKALDAFGGRTVVNHHPSSLKIYDKDGQNILATMLPDKNADGLYHSYLNVCEPWMNFKIVDLENNIWYGSDPANKTKLSSADDKWNLWIDNEQTGIYEVKADLVNMDWSHEYKPDTGSGMSYNSLNNDYSEKWYDLHGRSVTNPLQGSVYIVKIGNKVKKVIL